MNTTTQHKHYRQGDVQLRYVDSLPSKLKPAVRGKSAVVDGNFALLIHDSKPVEHYPQALPRGTAELMEQSEYNQEEIRRVTD